MYYIYFPFIVILAGLMFFECKKKQLPKWWPAVVFVAPVTTPYFIFKSRKNEGLILFMIFLAGFSAVVAGEIYLYSIMKAKHKYADLPPVTRQLIRYSDILKQTTQHLDDSLVELELQSKVQSKVSKLAQTIEYIDGLRTSMYHNQAAINQMVAFINDHRDYFVKKDLAWVYEIEQFYNNRIVIQHFKSLEAYLDNFESLLKYCYQNFDNITKAQTKAHLKNYDEYYLRYRRAVDAHNRFNVKRIEYQNKFLKKYPEVQPYLPAERQAEPFRLWK